MLCSLKDEHNKHTVPDGGQGELVHSCFTKRVTGRIVIESVCVCMFVREREKGGLF